jgi:surface protein
MENMFYDCFAPDIDLSNWDLRNVQNMNGMFMKSRMQSFDFTPTWRNCRPTMLSKFAYQSDITGLLDLSGFDFSRLEEFQSALSYSKIKSVRLPNTNYPIDFRYAFYYAGDLECINQLNLNSATNTFGIFYYASSLVRPDDSEIDNLLHGTKEYVGPPCGNILSNNDEIILSDDTKSCPAIPADRNWEVNMSKVDYDWSCNEVVIRYWLSEPYGSPTHDMIMDRDITELAGDEGTNPYMIDNGDGSYDLIIDEPSSFAALIVHEQGESSYSFANNWLLKVEKIEVLSGRTLKTFVRREPPGEYANGPFSPFAGHNMVSDFIWHGPMNATNMDFMFAYMDRLVNINLEVFDTSKVTNMYEMFTGAHSLSEDLDFSSFDTSKVEIFSYMFSHSFTNKNNYVLNLDGFNMESAIDLSYMFLHCNAEHISMNNWNLPNALYLDRMFISSAMTNIDSITTWTSCRPYTLFAAFHATICGPVIDISNFSFDRLATLQEAFTYTAAENIILPDSGYEIEFTFLFEGATQLKCVNRLNTTMCPSGTNYGMFFGCDSMIRPDITERRLLTKRDEGYNYIGPDCV